MSPIAIAMMLLFIVAIWGGLAFSLFLLARADKAEAAAETATTSRH